MKRRYGRFYKRRSQVYDKLRIKKLSKGEYLVEHEPSEAEFIVFRVESAEESDWVIRLRKQPDRVIAGFRTKNKAMETLAKEGPRALRIA